MYNTDSTSQDTQIKGITGLNVWCSLVEDESSLSLSLYLPVGALSGETGTFFIYTCIKVVYCLQMAGQKPVNLC